MFHSTHIYITKADWNCCLMISWTLHKLVTQLSHGKFYLTVFYNKPSIKYLKCAMLPDCTIKKKKLLDLIERTFKKKFK